VVVKKRKVWILGATSTIAHAYARVVSVQSVELLLVGRNVSGLNSNALDLKARGAEVEIELVDFVACCEPESELKKWVKKYGYPDEILIAYGTIGDHYKSLTNPNEAKVILDTNFNSVVLWCLAITECCLREASLNLIVVSSVAGDRGRGSNFIYGSAKGGLTIFLEGLQHSKNLSLLNVVCVKPGFVKTPMNSERNTDGILWAKPEQIALDILDGTKKKSKIIYTPWFWRYIMIIIKLLPNIIFNKLKI
jgi:short-subunit dehydrogenase